MSLLSDLRQWLTGATHRVALPASAQQGQGRPVVENAWQRSQPRPAASPTAARGSSDRLDGGDDSDDSGLGLFAADTEVSGQATAAEPKTTRRKEEAARALGRLLSGLHEHQCHQTKVLRFLEPIPELGTTATALRRDAARLVDAAGDAREQAQTVERRVEACVAAIEERHTTLAQALARLQHDVDTLGGHARAWGESAEHARAGISMVHERIERLNDGLSHLARSLEDSDSMMRRRLDLHNRILIAAGAILGILAIVGLVL
ncbi:MAG: hypothetical protein ACYTF9_04005 [Planctomycetota bacterium]|jgi:hypothetical protein